MADDIKIGDNVRLKTGGVPMKVEAIEGWKAICVWQDNNKTYREPYPMLVLRVDDAEPGTTTL